MMAVHNACAEKATGATYLKMRKRLPNPVFWWDVIVLALRLRSTVTRAKKCFYDALRRGERKNGIRYRDDRQHKAAKTSET